ncbi:hypothetical protein [Streptomyces sp. NPDC056169]|uniref:hypothetical protein n=1 Tax=Streptomyces sp. NPDC056169 TaxID=3345734 RepID=UPI0035DC60EF
MNKSLATLAAAGVAAASLLAFAPTASAAGCVTSGITTGFDGPGTVAYKAAGPCNDVNLTYAYSASWTGPIPYAGYYKNASGTWVQASAGWIKVKNGAYAVDQIVLISDLIPGTPFSVGTFLQGGEWTVVTH